MITSMHLILFILAIFWLAVIYNTVSAQNAKRHRHDKDDGNSWPFHHV